MIDGLVDAEAGFGKLKCAIISVFVMRLPIDHTQHQHQERKKKKDKKKTKKAREETEETEDREQREDREMASVHRMLGAGPSMADHRSPSPPAHTHAQKSRAGRRRRQDISEEELEEIREAFTLFDTDNDERLEYRELKVALRALGFPVKKAEVMGMMREYDRNDIGKIDAEQFKDIGAKD